ncbi:hypothetical protein [Neisseria sp.]|uniref:hypothetical protein n=1 Tax=Neisseria sp. TaxID=192066 RepID=UPI0028A2971A|nr:hypothetical protein [Neisseria sp.]
MVLCNVGFNNPTYLLLEPRPAFVAFAERHQQRPAARRADEIDEALLAQQPS